MTLMVGISKLVEFFQNVDVNVSECGLATEHGVTVCVAACVCNAMSHAEWTPALYTVLLDTGPVHTCTN